MEVQTREEGLLEGKGVQETDGVDGGPNRVHRAGEDSECIAVSLGAAAVEHECEMVARIPLGARA